MRALNNADFLTLWETGQRLHPLDRALLAIRASLPSPSAESPADWPLGRRNQALAQMRTLYFGPLLEGWTACPECGEKLEFTLDCRSLTNQSENLTGDQTIVFHDNTFRLPTSRDLAGIAAKHNLQSTQQAALQLIESCAVSPLPDPALTGPALSDQQVEELASMLAAADPLAEIALGFECPVCQHTTEEILDLPTFFWTEIETRARRLLEEVHTLAIAYGWAESVILAMTDIRRATYLQMVCA